MSMESVVFVVDDDASMRESTAQLLLAAGLQCKTFASAADFLATFTPDQPGCLIADLNMPGMNGLDMVRHLRERVIPIPILIVSGTGTIPVVVETMKLGIVDFFEKPVNPALLLEKVQAALDLDRQQRTNAASLAPISAKLATLTPREQEVLKLLVRGFSSKQIAMQLNTATKTIDNHRAKLMQKTGAMNSADLTRMAMIMELKN